MAAWDASDLEFMRAALDAARSAAAIDEVPVGAVVVRGGGVIASGANRTVADCDPSAHAEIVALRAAAQVIGSPRISDATLYVTLEPCAMCVGAIVQARIRRLVFAAYDEKAGALGSALDLTDCTAFNHRFEINGGLLADEAGELLLEFFARRR